MRGAVALVLEVVFFVLAFGVRSWVQWRRTGSSGVILPRRGAPVVERVGASAFVLAMVLMVAAPIADLSGAARVAALDGAWSAIVGGVVVSAGVILCFVAQLTMGDAWRIGVDVDERTDLVTNGVFASIRNPIFSAMLVAVVGLVLLVPNLWATGALVVLVIGLELQVRFVEEPYLERVHGDVYRTYADRAGRFVPGLGHQRPTR